MTHSRGRFIRLYRIKTVPSCIEQVFIKKFSGDEYTFSYYTYTGYMGKVYSADVFKNGVMYDNSIHLIYKNATTCISATV